MNEKNTEPATIADLIASSAAGNGEDKDFFLANKSADGSLKSTPASVEKVAVKERLRAANMLVAGSQLGPNFSDEYRRIKRPLLSNAFGKSSSLVDKGNLILITSSMSGEGKTHTASNLALSIAQEKDHTVLLVDCDATRQGISRMYGLGDRKGLADLIENDGMSISDVLLHTDIPEFCILSAGTGHEHVTESLASQRMSDIVDEMASRYDDRIIIFDGPPLLPTPETQVLAGLVGQVVFVIETGKTPQMLVEDALKMIPEEKAIGLIMNKSEGLSNRGGYYYGVYGNYGEKS